MEETLLTPNLRKALLKNRKLLEKKLKVKIETKAQRIFVDGDAFDEYVALKVLDALNFGFGIELALLLTNEDYMLEKINVKNYVRASRLKQVKGRVIGEKGKAKRTISLLSDCHILMKDSTVAILGETELIPAASKAIMMIIRGISHSTVYSFLEKQRGKIYEARHETFE